MGKHEDVMARMAREGRPLSEWRTTEELEAIMSLHAQRTAPASSGALPASQLAPSTKKKLVIGAAVLFLFILGALPDSDREGSYGSLPSTKIGNGHDWIRAGRAERMEYCEAVNQRIGDGRGAAFYYSALNSFYDSSVPSTLSNPAAEIVAIAHVSGSR